MPDAATTAYKDLCVDVNDPAAGAEVFAALLGLEVAAVDIDGAKLVGDQPEHTVWLNAVPESRTGKNRVHLDVEVASIADVEAWGARTLDDTQPWTVMTQEKVGEFCAFVRPPERLRRYRLYELVIDCADPAAVCRWWAERFGVRAKSDRGFWWCEDAPGMPWPMVFNAVPEPKTSKNRVHWDVWGDTAALVAAGARLLRARDDEISWDVLADPEGNEFCVFVHE